MKYMIIGTGNYVSNEYEIYGILDDYLGECKCYYMKKIF